MSRRMSKERVEGGKINRRETRGRLNSSLSRFSRGREGTSSYRSRARSFNRVPRDAGLSFARNDTIGEISFAAR